MELLFLSRVVCYSSVKFKVRFTFEAGHSRAVRVEFNTIVYFTEVQSFPCKCVVILSHLMHFCIRKLALIYKQNTYEIRRFDTNLKFALLQSVTFTVSYIKSLSREDVGAEGFLFQTCQ